MAIKQLLVDDLDGSEGAQTRNFALGNISYSIDLTDENHAKMEKDFEQYVKVARRRGAKPKVTTVGKAVKVTKPSSAPDLAAIRTWARGKGLKVSPQGRVPKDIVDQFNEEHNNGAVKPEFSSVN